MFSKLGWSREDHDKDNAAFDVSVRRAGFGHYDVTAKSENAKKLLGVGTFTYEESEWRKLNKELRNFTYTIEVL